MSQGGSTYRPSPEHFLWELRSYFFYFLIREPAYDEVKEKLRPLWNSVREALPELAHSTPYTELPELADSHTSFGTYIAALQQEVGTTLRCRENGAAADWVCHAIHAGVTNTTFSSADWGDSYTDWFGSVEVAVSAMGFAFVVGKVNKEPLDDEQTVADRYISDQDPGTTFRHWKQL